MKHSLGSEAAGYAREGLLIEHLYTRIEITSMRGTGKQIDKEKTKEIPIDRES